MPFLHKENMFKKKGKGERKQDENRTIPTALELYVFERVKKSALGTPPPPFQPHNINSSQPNVSCYLFAFSFKILGQRRVV